MNDTNTRKLFKQFKFLNKKTMPDNFECEDGWYSIICNMCKELKSEGYKDDFIITKIARTGDGSIEVHSKNGNNTTRYVIQEIMDLAFETCDRCGKNRDLESCDKCIEPIIEYPDEEEEAEDEADACDGTNNCAGGCASSGCSP